MKKIILIVSVIVLSLILTAVGVIYFSSTESTLEVNSRPIGAKIIINSQEYTTPFTLKLQPGQYEITASKDGTDQKKNIEVKRRTKTSIFFDFTNGEIASPTPQASLTPGIKNLPYESDHFRIDWNKTNNKYLVVPKIPFTAQEAPAQQLRDYWQQYEQYANESLDWLKSQGVTPTQDNIEWWGQEWWPEGARIEY